MKMINDRIEKIIAQISSGLYEKENSVRLVFLSFLAGESTFLLGEPGTAKSLIARRVSDAFVNPSEEEKKQGVIKFFDYLMSRFSQPDELFGPVSINQLKDDNYERKTECYLPKAQFAFLDEIWKANPAIQNALLTILNEHLFRNGKNLISVPLIGFVSASNELPTAGQGLEAIFDRFLIRLLERPVQEEENFFDMISGKADMTVSVDNDMRLSSRDIDIIRKQSETIRLSDISKSIISNVRKYLTLKNEEPNREDRDKYVISDRRWKKIANLMRVSAFCNQRNETDSLDTMLIANCIWSTEAQENEVYEIVAKAIVSDQYISSLEKKLQDFEDTINLLFYKDLPIIEEGKYKCENMANGDIVWISKEKDSYNKYLLNNSRTNLSFDAEALVYSDDMVSYKVLFKRAEINDVNKLKGLTQEQDKQYEDIIEHIAKYKNVIGKQLDYWREYPNIFISSVVRQPVINVLCHQNDVLESLSSRLNVLVGKYHSILRTHEILQTIKIIKPKINTIKEIEQKTIERMLGCFKPVVRKNKSKGEFIVFNDDNGAELLIPIDNINDIFSDCKFWLYEGGQKYYYQYNGDSLVIKKQVSLVRFDHYNLCIFVNRSAINRIIKAPSNKYDNIQSEINELIKKEKDLIRTDRFIEEGKKNEFINELTSSSKADWKSIKRLINAKQNEREIINSLRSKLNKK